MTVTNAPAAPTDAYTQSILQALGDQQPLDVLAATPKLVEAIIRSVDPALLAVPEKEGKCSMLQVVRHYADVEVAQGWRFRLVIAEDHPNIQGYDQDLWMARLWRDDSTVDDALASWTAARTA
ncbi:MAG: hypothetical protein JWO56_2294, partial [Acidobacteria bacterium]|nr:hypothetical protein [Acidobacteriota bacterium]